MKDYAFFSKEVGVIDKIYIWSVITEPLLFFVFSDSETSGLPLTLSRVFQLLFLSGTFLRFLILDWGFRYSIPSFRQYKFIFFYMILSVFSSLGGIFFGAYSIAGLDFGRSIDLGSLSEFFSIYKRPMFEVFILFYYFCYFVIAPRYILNTRIKLDYFIFWLVRSFFVVVVIGLIDMFVKCFGVELIPRHLVDSGWVSVGFRFHSVAGEPRDAFVYLLFGLSLLYLRAGLYRASLPARWELLLIIGCLGLTQSFSGIVGIVIGLALLIVFTRFSVKSLVLIFSVIVFSVLTVFILMKSSERIQDYFNVLNGLYAVLQSQKLPYLVVVQSPDIVPLWLLLMKILNYNFYAIFFGSGIGSTSFATNHFMSTSMITTDGSTFVANSTVSIVNNPRAQLTRLFFETGLFGLYIYFLVLIDPVRQLKNIFLSKYRLGLWVSAILLYGAVLGHRSNTGLIFAGLVLAIIKNRGNIFSFQGVGIK